VQCRAFPARVIWRSLIALWLLTVCAAMPAFAQAAPSEPPVRNLCPAASSGVTPESSDLTEAPPCITPREQSEFVDQFVHERLALWRQRLKLENWQIAIVMIRRSNLKPKTLGGIRWDKGKKSAVISILDVSDYRLGFREMLDDMEFTIVHELVHLELASLPRSEASRSSEELAVNQITQALLALDRQK
jgi:hypothetical protein